MQSQAAGDGDRPDDGPATPDGLLSQLEVIEEQPLAARAEAYAQLHEELSARLEGADAPRHG
ncbi:hypothetical protein [Leifsonia shinshuensis]|uniref:Uncharacterized protein n=1 Tax=Leifsonia shinshuensis TaxID=150026 RepID=A0A853CWT6_9MICO|nr:hypothetical protein [Leifsonia shinshuensis]NYJ24942.1 hypothetical protein [Leifsonia shinshuensis]